MGWIEALETVNARQSAANRMAKDLEAARPPEAEDCAGCIVAVWVALCSFGRAEAELMFQRRIPKSRPRKLDRSPPLSKVASQQ